MALVTVADIKKYMDITFTNTQEEACQMIIEGLEADLEHYIGRPVSAASFVEEHVAPANYSGSSAYSFFYDYNIDRTSSVVTDVTKPPFVLYTRRSPVVSVASLTVQGPSDSSASTAAADARLRLRSGAELPMAPPNPISERAAVLIVRSWLPSIV